MTRHNHGDIANVGQHAADGIVSESYSGIDHAQICNLYSVANSELRN